MLAFCDRCTCSVSLSSAAGGVRLRSPLQGSRSKWQLPIKSPCKGRCRRRRRRGAAPGPAIILSGRRSPCVGADALHRPASLRHRKAPRDDASIVPYEAQGRVLPGFAGYLPPQGGNAPLSLRLAAHPAPLTGEPFKRQRPAKPPLQGKVPPQAQKQPRTVFWVRGCFAGMRSGRLGVSGRRIPGWLSPKQRLPVWRAEHWPGRRRRRRAATADAAPPEFVPPPRCRPPAA